MRFGHVLAGHEPYPAIAVDRGWNLVASNGALGPMLEGVAPALLQPPVNCMRLALHPDGMAQRILNLAEWRAHLLHGLEREIRLTARRRVRRRSATSCSAIPAQHRGPPARPDEIMVGLDLDRRPDELSFFCDGHHVRHAPSTSPSRTVDRGILPSGLEHRRGARFGGHGWLERRGLAVVAPDLLERMDDLALGGLRPGRLE